MIKLSALMSVYIKDNPLWVEEALQSVLNQTVPADEILIAADGPLTAEVKNLLEEYAKKYPQIKNIFFPKNEGRGAALNKALPLCLGSLVAVVDADDINMPRRFEMQKKRFEEETDLAVLGGIIEEIDAENGKQISFRRMPAGDAEIKKFLKFRSPVNNASVMFRRETVLACGGYRHFPLLEDYYLWGRMAKAGAKMANLDEVLVKVRVGKDMFGRRGGFEYFKSNKALYDEFFKMGLLTRAEYFYILTVRFCAQVLMPPKVRALFYRRVLR